ncbi:hypothetical protein ACH5RR_001411 [Cinchona calisaya]|uniref:Uncharacterized protein n=1 Tax=Cinchona calisaya TaxID=153742 RepID=A0ABD3B3F8_9GENT
MSRKRDFLKVDEDLPPPLTGVPSRRLPISIRMWVGFLMWVLRSARIETAVLSVFWRERKRVLALCWLLVESVEQDGSLIYVNKKLLDIASVISQKPTWL